MNAHEATPEQLLLDAEDDPARHQRFIKLAVAVILQAIEDATADVPMLPINDAIPGSSAQVSAYHARDRNNRLRADRDEARAFLLTDNAMLRMWCFIAGLQPDTLLYYARHADAENRWTELGKSLRKHNLHRDKAA